VEWEPGLTYEPERLFAMLIAYLDDSQAPDGSPIYVIAGYVATATQWDQFERAWAAFLALERVECWSMRKFAQQKPPFDRGEGWRDWVIREAIKIINGHTLFGAYAAVASDEYRSILSAEDRRSLGGHEYPLCYQLCLMDLLAKVGRERKEPPLAGC